MNIFKKFYDIDYGPFYGSPVDFTTLEPKELENLLVPSIGELYGQVFKGYSHGPICFQIHYLVPRKYQDKLVAHFRRQKPTIFSKFWWHTDYRLFSAFWWHPGTVEQRKLFLAHLSEKYKDKYF